MFTLLFVYGLGCGSDDAGGVATDGTAASSSAAGAHAEIGGALKASAALLSGSWQVRMAKSEARAPFEGRASWVSYFGNRRDEALRGFKSESDNAALSRAHAEFAAMYRQAALLAANATLQVYGADRQPSDPADADYLLGVSGTFTGNEAEGAKLATVKAVNPLFAERTRAWAAADAALDAAARADLVYGAAQFTGELGELPGGALVTTELPLQGEAGSVATGDPVELWGLSRWHEARAREADQSAEAAVDLALDPFRLPFEPRGERTAAAATDSWLFMSPYCSAADQQYVANAALGRDTTDAMAATSLYAALAQACTREGNTLDVDCGVDAAALVGSAIEDAMAAQNGGQADGFHRPFADYARAGALRAFDLVARARADIDASGRLRINALDRSTGAAADPLFYLFVAAWDAGNRNTPRAAEIVHQNLSMLPGLHVARAPLDALHVRLSRNAVPGVPMH